MSVKPSIEDLIQGIVRLDRDACMAELRRFDRPRLDFTDQFLGALTLDRLRHLVLAVRVQETKRP